MKELLALRERLFDRPIDASKGEQSFYEELCNIFSEYTAVTFSVYPSSCDPTRPIAASAPCDLLEYFDEKSASDLLRRALEGGSLKATATALADAAKRRVFLLCSIRASGKPAAVLSLCSPSDQDYLAEYVKSISQYASVAISLIREAQLKQTILDTIPAYVYIKDRDFNIAYCNKCFRETFGDPENWKCFQVLKGSAERCPSCPSTRALTGGEVVKSEWISRNGRAYLSIHRKIRFHGSDHLLTVGIDVTDLKVLEEQLTDAVSELSELESIINKSPAVTFLWKNEEGWPVEFVTENISIFGYSPQDLTSGKVKFAEIVHPDDLPGSSPRSRSTTSRATKPSSSSTG